MHVFGDTEWKGNASADLQISQTVLLAMAGHDLRQHLRIIRFMKIWRNLAGFIRCHPQ
jgi:hypothetical protein